MHASVHRNRTTSFWLLLTISIVLCTLPTRAAEIAIVDVGRLMQQAKAAQGVQLQIAKLRSDYQAELKPMQDDLNHRGQAIAQQRSGMSPDSYDRQLRELQERADQYQSEIRNREERLTAALSDATLKIASSIVEVVDEVKAERSYNVVLTRSSVIGTTTAPDLTDEVLNRLNQRLPSVTVDLAK